MLKIFRLCRQVKSHKLRLEIYKQQLEKTSKQDDNSSSSSSLIQTYLYNEIKKCVEEYTNAQRRLLMAKKKYRESVRGNLVMRVVFDKLNEDILMVT